MNKEQKKAYDKMIGVTNMGAGLLAGIIGCCIHMAVFLIVVLLLSVFLTPAGITCQPGSGIQRIGGVDGIDVNGNAVEVEALFVEEIEEGILRIASLILQEDV